MQHDSQSHTNYWLCKRFRGEFLTMGRYTTPASFTFPFGMCGILLIISFTLLQVWITHAVVTLRKLTIPAFTFPFGMCGILLIISFTLLQVWITRAVVTLRKLTIPAFTS